MLIDLYTASTPNGRKVSIMLEETGLPYRTIAIDLSRGEQHNEEYLRIAPNHKIPAIVDHQEGVSLMESGAILLYLANKTGQLMSTGGTPYWEQLQWLMYQMGQVGPLLGQAHHFLKFNRGKSVYAEQRYHNEARKIYQVLDTRLAGREFLVGDYSIVDIATWPWIARYEFQQMDLHEYPNLLRWYLQIAARPAVQRGFAVPEPLPVPIP